MMGQAISDVAAMAYVVGGIFRGGRFEAHQRAHRMGTGLIRCEKHGMVEVGFRPVEQEEGTFSFALSACKLCRDEAQAEAERSKAEARASSSQYSFPSRFIISQVMGDRVVEFQPVLISQ